jgi:23S rRNA A2030 N6-methylase RlmJ
VNLIHMANKHFANYGDIWKHLPLGDLLRAHPPRAYWETHAGSALYELTPSPGRDHGVSHLLRAAEAQELLRDAALVQLLGPSPRQYPGSPGMALHLLAGCDTRFLFCDIDGESIESIGRAAVERGMDHRLTLVRGDGLDAVRERAAAWPETDLRGVLVLIDPFDPFQVGAGGAGAITCFAELAARGATAIFWYALDTPRPSRAMLWFNIRRALADEPRIDPASLWAGEMTLRDPGRANAEGISLNGCGLLAAHVPGDILEQWTSQGRAIAASYPADDPGGLDFAAVPID